MTPQRAPFELPMTMTISLCQECDKFVAHALDFDLVCVADSEAEATNKTRLAVKTYVEYGLSKGWTDEIMFPAPEEYWDKLKDATISVAEPIQIMDRRIRVYSVKPSYAIHEVGRAAVPA